MESLLIEAIRSSTPLVIVVALGFWRVLVALHKIDRRLVRVETKLDVGDDNNV